MRSWEIGTYTIARKKAKKDEPPLHKVLTLFALVIWLLVRNGYATGKTKSYELLLRARNYLDRVPEPYVTVKKGQPRRPRPKDTKRQEVYIPYR